MKYQSLAILLWVSLTQTSPAQSPTFNNYPTKSTVGFVLSCTQNLTPRLYQQGGFPPYQAGLIAAETCVCLFDNLRRKLTFEEFKALPADQMFIEQDIIDCLPNQLGNLWTYSQSY